MSNKLLSPKEAAAQLNITANTLAKWRMHGAGPRAVKLGSGPRPRVRYDQEAIDEFTGRKK